MRFQATRFGDDGKVWHLGVVLLVGITAWVAIISTTIALVNLITGH